jgi:hypothetical protein
MKNIAITALFFLSACAAVPTTTVRTLDEKANVTVIAKDLGGASISVDRGRAFKLTEKDLDKFRFGVLGVRNSARENSDTYTFQVDPGKREIQINLADGTSVNRIVLVSSGQNEEIELE